MTNKNNSLTNPPTTTLPYIGLISKRGRGRWKKVILVFVLLIKCRRVLLLRRIVSDQAKIFGFNTRCQAQHISYHRRNNSLVCFFFLFNKDAEAAAGLYAIRNNISYTAERERWWKAEGVAGVRTGIGQWPKTLQSYLTLRICWWKLLAAPWFVQNDSNYPSSQPPSNQPTNGNCNAIFHDFSYKFQSV